MTASVWSQAPASVCVLTPDGRGAIAVVRLFGPEAFRIADEVFRPRSGPRLTTSAMGRLRIGHVGAGLGDEVVAVVLPGEGKKPSPEVEFQCHGGSAAVALVVEALVTAGAERCLPEAWVARSEDSCLRAEAQIDLPYATTVQTAEILLDQVDGALDRDVQRVLALLDRNPNAADSALKPLLDRSTMGLRLLTGWRVALAGRPNVGKSRLLNALAGFERAIVSPTPGTTRDIVTVRTAFDGWPVELADTAGVRPTLDPIESSGVARARARQGRADLVLLVLDRSEPLTDIDLELLAIYPQSLVVANKADLSASWSVEKLGREVGIVSAERGDGMEALVSVLARRLVPESPPPDSGVPFRAAQLLRLNRARRLLKGGRIEAARKALIGLGISDST